MSYITTRDTFDHRGVFVKKGSPITFKEGAKIPKWVIEADKFKPADIPAEPKMADVKPKAAQEAVKKKAADTSNLV